MYSQGFNQYYISIGSGNGLVPNRWQAVIWTNNGLVNWRIYASLGFDDINACVYSNSISITWWRHQMETFSGLLALCAGNSSVTYCLDSSMGYPFSGPCIDRRDISNPSSCQYNENLESVLLLKLIQDSKILRWIFLVIWDPVLHVILISSGFINRCFVTFRCMMNGPEVFLDWDMSFADICQSMYTVVVFDCL